MRAIKFKCIYNIVLGSHESRCVLKWMTKSCSQNQMWQALDPRRRWPLSPVSASRALTVCQLSGTLGRPGCFEFDSSKYCPLSLADSAQRWPGASACQYSIFVLTLKELPKLPQHSCSAGCEAWVKGQFSFWG